MVSPLFASSVFSSARFPGEKTWITPFAAVRVRQSCIAGVAPEKVSSDP